MKLITEKARFIKALEMIEEISSDCQSTNPKRDWKESHDGICKIYEIIHSIRSPKCRDNHRRWVEQIDAAIIAFK